MKIPLPTTKKMESDLDIGPIYKTCFPDKTNTEVIFDDATIRIVDSMIIITEAFLGNLE